MAAPSNTRMAAPSNSGIGHPSNPGMVHPSNPGMVLVAAPYNPGVPAPLNPRVANVTVTDEHGNVFEVLNDEQFQPVVMPVVNGYEFVNPVLKPIYDPGDVHTLPPPSYGATHSVSPPSYDQVMETPPPPSDYSQLSREHVDEDSARAALIEEINQHRCYGSRAAKRSRFSKIATTQAYHLTLNTFVESREIYWAKLPYVAGQPMDGPEYGPAPAPWDLPCAPLAMFQDNVFLIEIPHTSHVMTCPQCAGYERVRCERCCGLGSHVCMTCSGRGITYTGNRRRTCPSCSGEGRITCFRCCGHGQITCPCCSGYRFVRIFIQLKVKFMDVLHEKVLYSGEQPTHEKILKAGGHEQWRLEAPVVTALENHSVPTVNQCSRELVRNAWQKHQDAKILMQRHVVRTIPVSECSYSWKNKDHVFWVYGTDHHALLIDYPQTCCCCSCNNCTIL